MQRMKETSKFLLDRFQEHVHQRFEAYCQKHDFELTENGLITYLIDQELIPTIDLQRYTILREFEQLHIDRSFRKTQAVGMLAHRFHLSERTVWSILKRVGFHTESPEAKSGSDRKK